MVRAVPTFVVILIAVGLAGCSSSTDTAAGPPPKLGGKFPPVSAAGSAPASASANTSSAEAK